MIGECELMIKDEFQNVFETNKVLQIFPFELNFLQHIISSIHKSKSFFSLAFLPIWLCSKPMVQSATQNSLLQSEYELHANKNNNNPKHVKNAPIAHWI